MRVAMLSYHTCPLAALGGKDAGGMNVYVRDLTRALGCAGVGVDVFTRSQDEHVPHVIHDLENGNRVVHIPAGPEVPLPRDELSAHLPEFVSNIRRFQEEQGEEYSLIHAHYWLSGLAAIDLAAAWDVPFVQMFHTLGEMKVRLGGTVEDPVRIESESSILASARRVVAATPAERMQLEWLYGADPNCIAVIPPGVDTENFRPRPSSAARQAMGAGTEGRVILFVGRIERLKGIDTLLEATARLRDSGCLNPRVDRLAVIGGDPDDPADGLQSLLETSRELKLEPIVRFLGKQPQESLPGFYTEASVVVMPSQYESFGLVALEAMACGTPVVASGVGGLLYLIQDGRTGYHVPDSDPGALATKLSALLSNPALRREFGRHAAITARGYDWKRIAEQVMTVYECVLAGESCAPAKAHHAHG